MASGKLCKFYAPSQPSAAHKLLALYIGKILRHRILRMVFEIIFANIYTVKNEVCIPHQMVC